MGSARLLLWAEFLLFFFGLPLYIYLDPGVIHPSVFILPGLALVFIYLYRNRAFKYSELLRWQVPSPLVWRYVAIVILAGVIMLAWVYWLEPDNLFNLPRQNWRVWLVFSFFYPLLSATGQEIIYRVFLFYRYRDIFRSKTAFILASGLAFSFVHLVYFSAVSLLLTLLMGLFLAALYWRHRSVLLTAAIHGALGNLAFSLGLGHYFWIDIEKFLS